MAVEGVSQSGGSAQAEQAKKKDTMEGLEKARNQDIQEKAQVRKERASGEVDETA